MRSAWWLGCVFTYVMMVYGAARGQGVIQDYIPIPDSCWADSVLHSLTLDEKIGQLIFARANKDNAFLTEIPEMIRKYNIGGVVFFKGSPYKQATATNTWQKMAKTPLFICIDAERGLAMRLDSTFGFPYMMTLGACSDDSLVYQVSSEIARGCRRMGIHINFGPVVDINSNPRNPVINSRSFGEDRNIVARKSLMYLKGLQDNHIMHTAKHFPGHGDTDSDSHYTLPVVKHSLATLDSLDLYPYKYLIPYGLEGVMAAHVFVPSLDDTKNAASSLSGKVITNLLQKKLHFSGLIFTDALEMKGVTNYYQPGEIEVKALSAGNDVLLMPQDINAAMSKIRQAIDSCWIWPEDIDEKCLKVLKFKQKYIPRPLQPVETRNLAPDLNPAENEILYRKIMSSAFTMLKNKGDIIPLDRTDTMKLASVSIGYPGVTEFQQSLGLYAPIDHYCLPGGSGIGLIDSLLSRLKSYTHIIVSIVNTSIYADRNFGLTPSGAQFLSCLQEQNSIILVFFGNPYAIGKLGPFPSAEAIMVAYQDNVAAYSLAAQALFGAYSIQGHLPVSSSDHYPVNYGLRTVSSGRMQYVLPGECNIDSRRLLAVDSLIQQGISAGAYPGCQVLAAWKGKVFYHKAFGTQSWNDTARVRLTDLYDLASVTKVAATTLAVMKLYEEGKVDPDERLGTYLPYVRKSNKRNLIVREIMAHEARLKSWIPFYSKVINNGVPDTNIFRAARDSIFSIPVADSLFMKRTYLDSLRKEILVSPLEKKPEYKYSDLGFYLLKDMVEAITHESIYDYLNRNFYAPLGLSTLTYNPWLKVPRERIVPTERDTIFRKQTLRGFVHDPGAAMLGGISGHAGLFSDANDLAVMLQMLTDGGVYGGHRYLKEETVREFTSVQFPEHENRRGMGFDKPLLQYSDNGPTCQSASAASFGHSGFTGTYIWGDPENNLVYVFLCNRVNPSADNHKLTEMNIRTRVHEMLYQAIPAANKDSAR
jgi:beta-N-acetylhexosaminidase